MKNKQFLDICYKFINRFIDSDELVKQLSIIDKDNIKKEDITEVNKMIDEIKNNLSIKNDSEEMWFSIAEYIINSDYFNKVFDSLSDYELLEFVTQKINVLFSPKLSQEEFDNLVDVGIENDERECLWRLAFNYEGMDIDFDKIVDYFIEIKDGYYLIELISAVGDSLDIDGIIYRLDDNEFIKDLIDRDISLYISKEQKIFLKKKLVVKLYLKITL